MYTGHQLSGATLLDLKDKVDHVVHGVHILQDDGLYEPTDTDICAYAKYLGFDAQKEPHIMAVAREGLMAPLPRGWKPCVNEDGTTFYYNTKTKESQREHPSDAQYKKLIKDERSRMKLDHADVGENDILDTHEPHYKDDIQQLKQANDERKYVSRDIKQMERGNKDTGTHRQTNDEMNLSLKEHKIHYERKGNDENVNTHTNNEVNKAETITIFYGYGNKKRQCIFQPNNTSEAEDTTGGATSNYEEVRQRDGQHTTIERMDKLRIVGNICDTRTTEEITIHYAGYGSTKMECSFQCSAACNYETFTNDSDDFTEDSNNNESLEEEDESYSNTHKYNNLNRTVVYDASINDTTLLSEAKTDFAGNDDGSITLCYGHGPWKTERTIKKLDKSMSASDGRTTEIFTSERKLEDHVKTVLYDASSNIKSRCLGKSSTGEIQKEAGTIKQAFDKIDDHDEIITICYGNGSEKK